MRDSFDRKIDYLRVSVTDRCPARCVYCMPPDGPEWISHAEIMRFEEILKIAAIAAECGVNKIKVTGGEPLARRGIVPFISALVKIKDIQKVSLTTNAVLLGEHLDALIDAGLSAINISLDALSEDVFKRIMRIDAFCAAQKNLNAALDAANKNKINLKINCVPIAGYNEGEIAAIVEIARDNKAAVRFIELMPLGFAANLTPVPQSAVRSLIEKSFGALIPCENQKESNIGEGPASYYYIAGFRGQIGFISALSHKFCAFCNRLRLTSTGIIKPCLASEAGIDIKTPLRNGANNNELKKIITDAAKQKPAAHNFYNSLDEGYQNNAQTNNINMYKVGG